MKIKGPMVLKGGVSFGRQIVDRLIGQETTIKLPFKATGFKCSNPDIDFDEKTGELKLKIKSGAPAKELTGPKKVFTNSKPGKDGNSVKIEIQIDDVPEIDKFKALPVKEEVADILLEKFGTMNDMLRFAKRKDFKKTLIDLPKIGIIRAGRIIKAIEGIYIAVALSQAEEQ